MKEMNSCIAVYVGMEIVIKSTTTVKVTISALRRKGNKGDFTLLTCTYSTLLAREDKSVSFLFEVNC